MNNPDGIGDHQARCRPYLLELRMLARDQADAALAHQVAAKVGQATEAILAEVETAAQARSAVTANRRQRRGGTVVLEVRLARLRAAARAATAAAREEDTAGLRHQVRRFEALTSAMWIVQSALSSPVSRTKSSARQVPAFR